ncbi:MAG: molybdate ABC transporter substrate-binding protein [Sedimentitalea sp.]|nr:molybdate ABC transporter substrate-binding protein [Sedimentitalea sp.]
MKKRAWIWAAILAAGSAQAQEPAVSLVAAGSLKAALGELAEQYSRAHDTAIETRFGPSGLIRESLEAGESGDIFASANMAHPQRLEADGRGGPVVLFARNRLCAIARPEVAVTTETLLEVLLDDDTRVGTSTPGADPSGDYAWAFFEKTGHGEALKAKALQLTGGPDSAAPPEGSNAYAWVLDSDQADVFVTYCTNAVLARAQVPELQKIALPEALAVGADYGLVVTKTAPPAAWHLAMYILSPEGQAVLDQYGFDAPTLPAAD